MGSALRDSALEAGVAFFFKQSAGPRPGMDRELDGRTWDEMPALGGARVALLS